MGGCVSRKEPNTVLELLDSNREAEACCEIWSQVVEQDKYDRLRYLNVEINNLVFEGGGTKGIAYSGAVKALHDLGILKNVTRFAGTSAGAYVAMKLCLSLEVDDLLLGSLDNIQKTCYDSGKAGFLWNVMTNLGWHSGNNLLQHIRQEVSKATGDADMTFGRWYKKTRRELCVVISNVSTGCVEYCHPKTTPEMSIAVAVRTSMSLPIIFQPYKTYRGGGAENLLCDGGLLDNYPVRAFDGWYLSMEKEDSFFHKFGQMKAPFDGKPNPRTVGLLLYNANESEHFQDIYTKRYGSQLIGERPVTKLAERRAQAIDKKNEKELQREQLIKSSLIFLGKLSENDLDRSGTISREELTKVFEIMLADIELRNHIETIFGTADVDVEALFDEADVNMDGSLSFTECLHVLQNAGASVRQLVNTSIPAEIDGMASYLSGLFGALDMRLRAMNERSDDWERTIGIYTDYVGTTDFTMELEDKIYVMKQGWRAVIVYLEELAAKLEVNEKPMLIQQECESGNH